MPDQRLSSFALGVALAVLSPTASVAQHAQPTVEDLKRVVEQAARHYEGRLKVVQDLIAQGRICSDEPLQEAQGSVAVARAWLAEAEGRRDDLRAELPKVIAYHEWRIQRYQSLRQRKAIPEEEAQAALTESETELRWARDRLTRLGGDPARQDKTGKGDKR